MDDGPRRPYRIDTGIKFFNHMLTGLASRACLNLNTSYRQTSAETLAHVVVEDTGLAFGRAVRELLDNRIPGGVNGRGTYTVAFDEALVAATLAFDGRAYTFVHGSVPALRSENVEDVQASTLRQFFEGLAQGAGAVVQIQCFAGDDPASPVGGRFQGRWRGPARRAEPLSLSRRHHNRAKGHGPRTLTSPLRALVPLTGASARCYSADGPIRGPT